MKGIKITKKKANDLRKNLIKKNQVSREYKLKNDECNVYIPLIENYDASLMESLKGNYPFTIEDTDFMPAQYKPQNFMDFLDKKIPEDEILEVKKSFDIIGDIVILEIPPSLEKDKKIIGEAVLKFTKRRSVYYKKSKIHGVTRTRDLEFLAGEDNLETVHKEFGIRFKLNPSTVYFSPRLATERSRIVSQVNNGEVIIDFFAGIGSFPISIAHAKNVTAYSVDINPEAYKYVQENIKLNKLIGNVIPIEGDINDVINDLPLADRIIMNLPQTAKEFLTTAINHLNKGGILNYYEFSADYKTLVDRVKKIAYPRECKVLNVKKVKSQSPGIYHMALDVKIN